MKTIKIFLLCFFFLSTNLFSQVRKGYYVTNNNDTIKCSFKVSNQIFHDRVDVASLHGTIMIIENGVTKKYKPHEIKLFNVIDIDSVEYKFKSFDTEKLFVHVFIEGRITLCHIYGFHPYDHGYMPYLAFFKDKKFYTILMFNEKKILKEILADNPEVLNDYLNGKYKNNKKYYENIVIDYNKKFSNR